MGVLFNNSITVPLRDWEKYLVERKCGWECSYSTEDKLWLCKLARLTFLFNSGWSFHSALSCYVGSHFMCWARVSMNHKNVCSRFLHLINNKVARTHENGLIHFFCFARFQSKIDKTNVNDTQKQQAKEKNTKKKSKSFEKKTTYSDSKEEWGKMAQVGF